ncbi:hypothetical protein Barb6XT_00272 [Bacteroidales bacterium Barb6XT]|nr:hypothetical protein Barb6XT_00272 [Bacteroidales bacterium Barb6XT]
MLLAGICLACVLQTMKGVNVNGVEYTLNADGLTATVGDNRNYSGKADLIGSQRQENISRNSNYGLCF